MNLKYVILGTALLLPMTLLSCDDSKVPSEPVDDASAGGLDAPSFTTVGFGSRWHDPHIVGATIYVFSGSEDTKNGVSGDCEPGVEIRLCDYGGVAKRFRSKDGAEVNTLGFQKEDGSYAGIYGKRNLIAGKLLTRVKELDFSYAGGPPGGGSPRFSIPIDDDLPIPYDDVVPIVQVLDPIDGATDGYAFIDANGCGDGDSYVGVINAEDADRCLVNYKSVDYTSWTDFETQHPTWRIATDAVPFAIVDQPGHYLLFKWDVR